MDMSNTRSPTLPYPIFNLNTIVTIGSRYHTLGIGPGAHSYNGKIRQFNVRNLVKYLGFLEIDQIPCQIEVLQRKDHINEYIMHSLRTKWGCNLKKLKEEYDFDLINACHPQLDKFKKLSLITYSQQLLRLTDKGKLLADTITSEFFQS